jgi:periplasmic divalent cation tolerance protein
VDRDKIVLAAPERPPNTMIEQERQGRTMVPTTEVIQILTTTPSQADAERIAAALIDERLAACVQISGPLTSTYRWQGQIETAEEWQCAMKTRRDLFEPAAQVIRAHHPYDVPEILALAVVSVSADYLGWLDEQVQPP